MVRRASEPVRAVLLAAALLSAYLVFHELVTFFVTLVITLVIALPLAAAADGFERRGLPRTPGALLALLAGLGVLAGLLALVIPAFIDQGQQFIDAIPQTFESVRSRISDATGQNESEVGRRIQEYVQGYADEPVRLIGPAAQVGLGVAGVLGTLVVVLMTAVYIAMNPRPLVSGLLSLFPVRRRGDVERVLHEIRQAWLGWLRGVGIDMVISGALLYAGLKLIGLDFALVFAVVSALFVLIPYFGSFAAGLPPVVFALADSPGKALAVLGIYLAVQQIEGNVIVPMIMARQVKLHPAIIVIGVVVVGRTIGLVGLFVAVPIISAVMVLARTMWVEPLARNDERRSAAPDGVSDSAGLGGSADGPAARAVTTTLATR